MLGRAEGSLHVQALKSNGRAGGILHVQALFGAWTYRRLLGPTRIRETEPHPENDVLVVENASFWACFGHLKGGVRDPCFMGPIYV